MPDEVSAVVSQVCLIDNGFKTVFAMLPSWTSGSQALNNKRGTLQNELIYTERRHTHLALEGLVLCEFMWAQKVADVQDSPY